MSELLLRLSNCPVPKAFGTGLKKQKNQGFGPLSFSMLFPLYPWADTRCSRCVCGIGPDLSGFAMTGENMAKSDRLPEC